MNPTHPHQVSDLDKEMQALGESLIQPDKVPPWWPEDFFRGRMDFGSTAGMTNGAKGRAFRHRVTCSTLRSLAYEKVLAACLARTRLARIAAFLFALTWGAAMLAFNWSKVDHVKASLGGAAAVVPGLASMAKPMTPEQARALQQEELRKLFEEAN